MTGCSGSVRYRLSSSYGSSSCHSSIVPPHRSLDQEGMVTRTIAPEATISFISMVAQLASSDAGSWGFEGTWSEQVGSYNRLRQASRIQHRSCQAISWCFSCQQVFRQTTRSSLGQIMRDHVLSSASRHSTSYRRFSPSRHCVTTRDGLPRGHLTCLR